MITIFIHNKPYQVREDQNLLNACLTLGFNLPYFCWHPALHSVGACRQCAVKLFKDEKDTRGKIVMSCMTPVTGGMRISIDDPEAKKFRSSVIEWFMLNHPHDCPVCDEGGECHLQDMTIMTGHTYRRTRFRKRTHRNQELGPFVNHEMNRCIACYRCVRFYRDHAGGRDLTALSSHDSVYFGRHEDGTLESEFSGNLVEICPTGVFTDKTFKRHYARKWDLQTAPSVCVHCGLGCNTIPGERYGTIRRILNRYNHAVNGYFLCDRGRFGYEFVNNVHRVSTPLYAADGKEAQPVDKTTALDHICDVLSGSKNIIGIGSPRASLESNFALLSLVGKNNFYSGMAIREHRLVSLIINILQKGPARSPSLHEIESADAVLVLGEDVTNTAPLLDLALRQAARNKPKSSLNTLNIPAWDDGALRTIMQDETGPLYLATATGTKLDDLATKTHHAAPDDIARLGFAVAHELDAGSPSVSGLQGDVLALAKEIAETLKQAQKPLIISGTSLNNKEIIQAAANIAGALCKAGRPAGLFYTLPECNSMGVCLLADRSLEEALSATRYNKIDAVFILENDLYQRTGKKAVSDFFDGTEHVIVIDAFLNQTASKAEVLLPGATCAESDGTFVNNEGRAQRFYQVFKPGENIQDSWKWIRDILTASERLGSLSWTTLDNIVRDMTDVVPILTPVRAIAPPADFRIAGAKIPRQPHRYSGRTAIMANRDVHEPKPPEDPDTPLSFSMEGYDGRPPASLISRYWSPGWNSVQALNKFQQEVGGTLYGGDPGMRLIEPAGKTAPYFKNVPDAFKSKQDAWLVFPLHHIYGSEELSMLSPDIAMRAAAPCCLLNPADALRIGVVQNETVELTMGGSPMQLTVALSSTVPAGTAGMPARLYATAQTTAALYAVIEKLKP